MHALPGAMFHVRLACQLLHVQFAIHSQQSSRLVRLQQSRVVIFQPCGTDVQFVHCDWRHLVELHCLSICGNCHILYGLFIGELRCQWDLRYLSLPLHDLLIVYCLYCLCDIVHPGQ